MPTGKSAHKILKLTTLMRDDDEGTNHGIRTFQDAQIESLNGIKGAERPS
jgi:hypothetical protein